MTAVVATLNVSVTQIESDLRAGKSVDDIAQDWSEPRANVAAVLRDLQARDANNGHRPPVAAVSSRPTPVAATPLPSVDALVNAAARSKSKRTQALGVKLADQAAVIRKRLADERAEAEAAEQKRAEREAAQAEIRRLEEQLAAARAKAGLGSRRGGGRSVPQRETTAGTSDALICAKGCGRTFTRAGWQAKHQATCGGAA